MFSSHALWNLKNKFTTQEFNFEALPRISRSFSLMTTLWSPTHLHAASPFTSLCRWAYTHIQSSCESVNARRRLTMGIPGTPWLSHHSAGHTTRAVGPYWNCQLQVPQVSQHPEEGSPSQHPGAALHKRTSPSGWAVTQPSAAFHRALWEYTKYFKWEDTSCSQCQTQNQCMVGSSQVLTLRLHLTWLNTKALCWQRNKSLPKTYSNYGCSQGPYKHQVPLPSSCVSFSFSNRIFKRNIIFWVRRL